MNLVDQLNRDLIHKNYQLMNKNKKNKKLEKINKSIFEMMNNSINNNII